jgi:outer membrane immunogenic protein
MDGAPSSWSGVYVSGGLGYGIWAADTTTVNPVTGACVLCVQQTQGGKGWFGTAGLGYDRQFNNWIVGGVFADADFSNIKGTIQDQGPFFAGKLKETRSWAVGPRVGLLMTPQTLTYVNGGFTQTHFSSASMVRAFNGASSTFVTPSFDRSGWFVGGGVERAFSLFGLGSGWFWRSEYRYASYGRTMLSDSVPGAGPVVVSPAGVFLNPQNSITFKPAVQTIRTEIVYKFNWPG